MPLVCQIRDAVRIPVEVDSIGMDIVRGMNSASVSRLTVQYGNSTVPLGELFHVSGSAAEDQTIVWQGDCSAVKHIGAGLIAGTVRIEGRAGMHLGAGMSGGNIICEADVADWAGAEMRGGTIRVLGDAGSCLGSVYRGGRCGMTGGRILVDGSAGHEIGRAMRRGLIAVRGACGDAPGYAMIAGTIMLAGQIGARPGAGMKRGSIISLKRGVVPAVLPTFRISGRWSPEFLPALLRSVHHAGFPLSDDLAQAEFHRLVGDFLELGKGEILYRAE